jgi:hypothetical protein
VVWTFHPLYIYSRPTIHSHSLALTHIDTQSFHLTALTPYQSITYWYQLTAQWTTHPSLIARAPKHPITMSSSRTKKNVGFERGTKPAKSHHHHDSRDSGVGSSSASDRASLGTAPDSPFTYEQVRNQRQILGAVQEALDAANEKIRQLEAATAKLNTSLTESNKENRLLKREKAELHNELDAALDKIDDQAKIIEKYIRSETSPKRSDKTSSTSTRSSHREEKKSSHRRSSSASGRRSSWREMPVPLYDRHTPPHTTPNPFTPRAAPLPAATYPAPGPVKYATNQLSYAAGPTFGHPPSPVRERYNDGRYHLSPV